ncbi:UNVERIFIED_CONTAM: hypothetical protein PYX00_000614 [Menopon gallinae]|uniref:Phenoloxidase-activating factor 2 n=1 Tax=Menopon gallinae TaxID=328185 RepID=A0AAW2IAQ2_9NEOP
MSSFPVPEHTYARERRSYNNETVLSRTKRQFGGWQNLLSGPCITSQGKLGRCTSFRACYPYFKLPDLTNWESWVLGVYDTCSYFTENGEQNNNVGRPVPPQTTTTTTTTTSRPDPSTLNPIPPNWPPPIPTHPPDHTIPPLPTHPPSPGYPGITHPTVPPPTQRPTTQRPTLSTYWPFPTLPTVTPPRPVTTTTPRPVPTFPTRPTTPLIPDNEIVDNSCGAKNGYQDQERIVGGQSADLGEWPWIAALFNSGRQFCGGSLIDHEHILTAAHCVAHMSSWDVARMTVRLGDHNIRINTETKHVEKKVKRVVRHRGFDPRTLYNDVAVLTLDTPVTFTKNIRPICLPSGNQNYAGQPATVIGWGSLRESGAQPAVLQEVSIPIWTNQDCRIKYGAAAPGGIVEHFLCAGQPSRDSCSGDSGGPLMVNQGKWTQVGIVSWGIGCGKGQYPGVYTRVTHFMPWITKNLK